jgi:hypothetical protein
VVDDVSGGKIEVVEGGWDVTQPNKHGRAGQPRQTQSIVAWFRTTTTPLSMRCAPFRYQVCISIWHPEEHSVLLNAIKSAMQPLRPLSLRVEIASVATIFIHLRVSLVLLSL